MTETVQTVIDAPPELLSRLKEIAAIRGVPVATVIREALEEKARQQRPKPKSIGIGRSGRSDTAAEAGDMKFPPRSWR